MKKGESIIKIKYWPFEALDRPKVIRVWIDKYPFEIYNDVKDVLLPGMLESVVEQYEQMTTDLIALAGGCYGRFII